MYDPHTILVYSRRLTVCRLDNGDYPGPKPWGVVLNPLRYAVTFGERRQWGINRKYQAFYWPDALAWHLYRRYAWALRNWMTRRKFRCRACGVQCDTAPLDSGVWRTTAVCPVHCPEHDFEYQRDVGYVACETCGEPAPYDWY